MAGVGGSLLLSATLAKPTPFHFLLEGQGCPHTAIGSIKIHEPNDLYGVTGNNTEHFENGILTVRFWLENSPTLYFTVETFYAR
jgi:hypothetical protein